jgi:hypothetical protein
MTLRRYAPLALAALAVACKPDIETVDRTTVEYALFNPAASQIPTPNDIAFNAVSAFLPGGAAAAAPCNAAPTPQAMGLCAYARAGGFPTPTPVEITFLRGTLGSDGVVAYAPSPDALNTTTLVPAGPPGTPSYGIVDLTATAPIYTAVPAFAAASGKLTIPPPGGAWTAGHKYVVVVLGGALGPTTAGGAPYTAMPPFYILREAVVNDLNLTRPENQILFPGDAAAKAAAGAALEPLRANYRTFYELAGASLTTLGVPFADAISFQTFQIAPGGSVTIADAAASDPADLAVTGGAVAMIDAFTLQSSVASATVQAVTFNLAQGDGALANLFVSSSATCTGTALGTSAADPVVGNVAIPLTNWLDVGNTQAVALYVCATTKTPGAATLVSGGVSGVTPFAGTGFTATGTDDSAVLTVNP